MGADLHADDRALHGIGIEVVEAERAKVIAELADLDHEAEQRLAEVVPELLQERRRRREALAKLDAARAAAERLVLRACRPVGGRLLDPVPPPSYLLRLPNARDDHSGFLEQGIVGAIVAPPGAGKSMAVIQLGISIATGLPWLDRFPVPRPGKVLVLAGEFTRERADRRLQRMAAMMGVLPEKADELGIPGSVAHHARHVGLADALGANLYLEALSGTDVSLQAAVYDSPRETSFAEELRRFLADNAGPDGWRLIVIDTLARFGGPLVERDNFAATALVRTLETLRAAPGAPTVLVLHHPHKGALGGKADQGAARGASGLVGAIAWMLNLELVERHDRLRLRITKTNDGPPVQTMTLERERFGFLRWLHDGEDDTAMGAAPTISGKPGVQAVAPTRNNIMSAGNPWCT